MEVDGGEDKLEFLDAENCPSVGIEPSGDVTSLPTASSQKDGTKENDSGIESRRESRDAVETLHTTSRDNVVTPGGTGDFVFSFDHNQNIRHTLLNLHEECRRLDRLMGTSFVYEDHFSRLLERVRERGANTPRAGEHRIHGQLAPPSYMDAMAFAVDDSNHKTIVAAHHTLAVGDGNHKTIVAANHTLAVDDGNHKTIVAANHTLAVDDGNHKTIVAANHTLAVGDGNHKTIVAANHALAVDDGNHKTIVAANHTLAVDDGNHKTIVAANHTLAVGDGNHKTIVAANHTLAADDGNHKTIIAADDTLAVGDGNHKTIVAANENFEAMVSMFKHNLGEKVRQLKASTKNKAVWQPEVNKVLELKKQLTAAQAQGDQPTSGGSVASLEKAVAEQGEKVRQLKASTKDKAVWQPEVNKLLELKKQLAAAQARVTSQPTSGARATSLDTVESLEKAIAEQGDKVRKLKASTKDKAVWTPEFNILLELKKRLAALQVK